MHDITPKKLTHEQEREALKRNRKIEDLGTGRILLYLVNKHRFFLSLTVNVLLIAFLVVHG